MRASRVLCLTATVALLLCHVSATAAPISQGSKEFYGGLSFTSSSYSYEDHDLGSVTTATVAPGFGYFLTDGLELRAGLEFTFLGESNGSSWNRHAIGVGVLGLWHFPSEGNVVPFVGAGAGFSVAGDSDGGDYDPLIAAPIVSGGIKVFFTDSACVTLEAQYHHQLNAMYAEDYSGNVIALVAAFSAFP